MHTEYASRVALPFSTDDTGWVIAILPDVSLREAVELLASFFSLIFKLALGAVGASLFVIFFAGWIFISLIFTGKLPRKIRNKF